MLYVVVAQMRVSFWLKRACGLPGPVVNQILHRGVAAMTQAPEIWMENVYPYAAGLRYYGQGRLPIQYPNKFGPTHSIYDISTWIALKARPALP